jgi:hypothetical protein
MAVPVAGVVGTLLFATVAAADPATPTPAPPERSWYGTVAPAAAPELDHPVRHIIQRGGVFLLGGATYLDGAMNGRLDLGVPTPSWAAPRLRLVLVIEGTYESRPMMVESRTLEVTPTAQYEWHLPFELKSGELLVIASVGLRRSTLWLERPDEAFYPSTWESADTWAFRGTAGIEYRGTRGLIVSLQPFSVVSPFTEPDPPDPRWMENAPTTNIAASLVAGYQFQ